MGADAGAVAGHVLSVQSRDQRALGEAGPAIHRAGCSGVCLLRAAVLRAGAGMFYLCCGGITTKGAFPKNYNLVRRGIQVAERLSVTLRSDLFEAFLRREIGFFDRPENSTGMLHTQLLQMHTANDVVHGGVDVYHCLIYSYFAANLTTRLANEPRLVDMGFGNSVARQMQVLSTLLISLVIGFTASWQIVLVVIACLPLNICSAVVQSAVASGQQ